MLIGFIYFFFIFYFLFANCNFGLNNYNNYNDNQIVKRSLSELNIYIKR